jgi:hypothetical protein
MNDMTLPAIAGRADAMRDDFGINNDAVRLFFRYDGLVSYWSDDYGHDHEPGDDANAELIAVWVEDSDDPAMIGRIMTREETRDVYGDKYVIEAEAAETERMMS